MIHNVLKKSNSVITISMAAQKIFALNFYSGNRIFRSSSLICTVAVVIIELFANFPNLQHL